MKEVVVVNFKSPPFSGIGGRRWGKITRYFLQNGIKVHLIYANWGEPKEEISYSWLHHPLLKRYSLSPGIWSQQKLFNWKDRIIFKWLSFRARWRGEYSIFDEGRWSIAALHSVLDSIHSNNKLDALFVTGPPFSWITEVSNWNQRHQIPLWVDIRDPWLKANNWGMQNLSNRQRNMEKWRYSSMFEGASFVSSPTFSILSESVVTAHQSKKVHLAHFFDWEDWERCEGLPLESNLMIYSGQYYVGMDEYIGIWKSIIKQKREVKWEIYSKDFAMFKKVFGDCENVRVFPDRGSEVFNRLAVASGLVLCLADYNRDYFTTKYYDYLPAQKPILYIGPQGDVFQKLKSQPNNACNEWFKEDNFLTSGVVFTLANGKRNDHLTQNELAARGKQILDMLNHEK